MIDLRGLVVGVLYCFRLATLGGPDSRRLCNALCMRLSIVNGIFGRCLCRDSDLQEVSGSE